MIRRLAERLFKLDPEKQDDDHRRPGSFTRMVISSNTRLKQPMLTRWRIVQNRQFGLYVHEWHRPDSDRDCHDHPWWFGGMVLRGGYVEERRLNPGKWYSTVDRIAHRRFRWHTMPLDVAHRVPEVEPNTWTLVLVGPKAKSWGFYVHDVRATLYAGTPGGGEWRPVGETSLPTSPRYVPWETYIAQGGNPDPFNC